MKINIRALYGLFFCAIVCGLSFISCKETPGENVEKSSDYNEKIVINEVMAQNFTGLVDKKGELNDWIEIKNISSSSIELGKYKLALESTVQKDSTKNDVKVWEFPEMTLEEGATILVYTSKTEAKKDDAKAEEEKPVATDELRASFKMPSKNAHLMLLKGNKIMSDVTYDKLNSDQVYRRIDDGTYEKSYQQTPGLENDAEGFEAYNTQLLKQRKSPLLIWEVMSRELSSSQNWVEVRNLADSAISLQNYCLTDNPKKMDKWHFPAVKLQPGECFVTTTRGPGTAEQNRMNANFKLNKGESVLLTKDGKFVDGVCAKATTPGTSIGRAVSHAGFYYFATPSKGVVGESKPCRYITEDPVFVKKPGLYSNAKSVGVAIDAKGAKIHYTLDGSEPTVNSPVMKDSIVVNKTTVIRAFAEGDGNSLHSRVVTGTYFVNVKHTLPVMNISVLHADLYDYNTGIYADGPGAGGPFPHKGANYWKDWEKSANIEYYDGKSSFSRQCGLKIFGGFSRAEAKKSFSIKFRQKYGSKLDFDLYNQGEEIEVKKFVLRSGSQDVRGVMVRDEFFTSLMAKTNPKLMVQAYRPVALYVNGEYFGLYYIREKVDEDYVAQHLDVSNDSISIIFSKYLERGSRATYDDVQRYVASHTMKTKADYDYAAKLIDFESLIDQKLGEIYSGNTDVGNVRIVRSTDAKSDKKWHWIFYDLDATWVGSPNCAMHISSKTGVTVHNVLIANLLKSPDFRQLFLERLSLHMHKTFTPQNTTAVFDNLIKTIQPEMVLNCQRWPGMTYQDWQTHVEKFRAKFADRHKLVLDNLREYLAVTPDENKKYFGDLGF